MSVQRLYMMTIIICIDQFKNTHIMDETFSKQLYVKIKTNSRQITKIYNSSVSQLTI